VIELKTRTDHKNTVCVCNVRRAEKIPIANAPSQELAVATHRRCMFLAAWLNICGDGATLKPVSMIFCLLLGLWLYCKMMLFVYALWHITLCAMRIVLRGRLVASDCLECEQPGATPLLSSQQVKEIGDKHELVSCCAAEVL